VAASTEVSKVVVFYLNTGKILWQDSYNAPYTLNPAAIAHGKGPKSTPVVANGRVYVPFGRLYGDCGTYSGWMVGVPLDGNNQLTTYRVSSHKGASLWAPSGPAIDAAGNLYVADAYASQIEKVTPAGDTSVFALMSEPWGLAFSGNVFDLFVGGTNCCPTLYVYSVDSSGNVSTDAYLSGYFSSYVDFDPSGNLYIGNQWGGGTDILKMTPIGSMGPFITPAGGYLGYVQGVAVNPSGTGLYWARPTTAGPPNYQISRAPLPSGTPVSTFVPAAGGLSNPQGIAFDPITWSLFVANAGNNTGAGRPIGEETDN
jgi:DNA-binding beta-propeller fold protein YncE